MVAVALGGVVLAVVAPEAAVGGIGMAVGCGAGGALLIYLDAPRRRPKAAGRHGPRQGDDPRRPGTPGSVAGYQMVELTLEVQPKDGLPFQVKRKFSSGHVGHVDQGRRLDVVYDPANPQKVELA